MPVFLRRSVDILESERLFAVFDAAIDREVLRLMDKDYDNISEEDRALVHKLRALPRKMGGLGMLQHASGVGEKNLWTARISFQKYLDSHYPALRVPDDYYYYLSLPELTNSEEESDPNTAMQRFHEQQDTLITEQVEAKEDKWFAAWFRSNHHDKGSGKWLDPLPPHMKNLTLDNCPFVCQLRARCGLVPITNDMLRASSAAHPPHNVRTLRNPMMLNACSCAQGEIGTTRYSPLHCLDCEKLRGLASKRHNAIRDCLIDVIQKANPGVMIQSEPLVENHTQRPDILVYTPAATIYLDVSVTNPSSPTALTNARSATISDAANHVREQSKRNHYAGWQENVQPFVMEATGRFGPLALQYLNHVTDNAGTHRASFIHKFQATLAKFNGFMFKRWIDSLQE